MTSNITCGHNRPTTPFADVPQASVASPAFVETPWSRRTALATAVGLIAAMSTGPGTALGLRQGGTPAPVTATGVSTQVLGSMEAPTAPGETLSLRRIVFEPGSSLDPHTHPGVTIYWIESGTLGFTLLDGEASITRAGDVAIAATPAAAAPVPVGTEISATTGDVLTFDATAAQAERAIGEEPVVVLLTNLGPTGGRFREPVEGTPSS
jgi:quercetin dioxygenase-like cupin family protein